MKVKQLLVLGFVMILMTGTLSTQAATTEKSLALEPWTNEVIDQADNIFLGRHVSIDHYKHDGRAYISYYDSTYSNLKIAFQVTPGTGNCFNADWECETIDDSTNAVGQYSSIDVFEASLTRSNGLIFNYAKIGISYYDASDHFLKYAQRSCSETAFGFIRCSWVVTSVDGDLSSTTWPYDVGKYTSFQFLPDGTPVIYYHGQSGTNANLGYVRRAKLEGSITGSCYDGGWECETIAQSNANRTYGTHISADGNAVAYYDGANDQLMLAMPTGTAESNTCGVINHWNCIVVDSDGDVGRFVSLLSGDASNPLEMAYYDATNGKVKYAYATTGTGNCTNNDYICFDVDTIGIAAVETGIGLSMALDLEGFPIIAYQDFSDQQGPSVLKIARPAAAYDNFAGNCGEPLPLPGQLAQYWQCEYLDAEQYSDLAAYVDISVSPAGLASVAYFDYATLGDYSEIGRLKVAQQHFPVYLPLIKK